ncbi:MAG: PepSY domain-containing protein [Methylotenera sp.]|nr:PepSY domain-containing protein [Methylotenera sp.]MDO9232116.1 PepSY domain-containing protein [Methylotenera sp.]MDO9390091.1 PepSY domain-containing protein [Methylotenera sp.]MDP1596509.1 PepSY domain-containing protein [Methylotenera sp.]MDP1753976.1 PepSY domain-containing protein [Methylotenera sp.]
MKNSIYKTSAATILMLGILSTNAVADDDDLQEMEAISKQFGLISLDEAKAKALASKPGVVKDADLESRKFSKGWDYEFEIIDADGKEWDVVIDAKTGKVGSIKRDWF